MTSFYESLEALLSPGMIKDAAVVLEEKEQDIKKASSSIIASLLGVMAKSGNTPQIRNIFEEAGNRDILSDTGIFSESLTHDQQNMGDEFLQQLLGDKAADFTEPISKHAGISTVATNRLVSVVSAVFVGFFGRKMVKDGMSLHGIINGIKQEEAKFASEIPAGLFRSFGLVSVLKGRQAPAATAASAQMYGIKAGPVNQPKEVPPTTPEKKKSSWVTWLVIIIALLLLLFWWRSCRNTAPETMNTMPDSTSVVSSGNSSTQSQSLMNNGQTNGDREETTDLSLPNGQTIRGYKNGTEEKLINFLASDEYKNASDKDLQERWFEFDHIDFEFGSGTELKEDAKEQLDNLISIIKAHGDTKVMIAAFADKKGTDNANMRVSQERARTIESLFEKGGIGSQVVRTEGLGDTYAKHSADAPESDRAKDRDIALRFVK